MRTLGKKISIFSLGVLVSLVTCEIMLRIIGAWHVQSRHLSQAVASKDKFTILCVGNSHTEGVGAQKGEGYPEQLKKILQKRYPDVEIEVVNRGFSNATSTNILEYLQQWIKDSKPSVVTVRMGEPNSWNYSGLLQYERKMQKKSVLFLETLEQFKLVRLAQRLFFDVQNIKQDEYAINYKVTLWLERLQNRNIYKENRQLSKEAREELLELLTAYSNIHPHEHFTAHVLSQLYFLNEQHEQAIYWTEQTIKRFGRFHFLSYELIEKMKKHEKAFHAHSAQILKIEAMLKTDQPSEKELQRMGRFFDLLRGDYNTLTGQIAKYEAIYSYNLEMSPGSVMYLVPYMHRILMQEKRYDEALEALLTYHMYNTGLSKLTQLYPHLLREVEQSHPEKIPQIEERVRRFNVAYRAKFGVDSLLVRSQELQAEDWAIADIKEAISRISSLGIEYVILNYPPSPYKKRLLDEKIRDLAQAENYKFIDTTKHMAGVVDGLPDKEHLSFYAQRGVADEHLNGKGYAILAEELADYLGPFVEQYKKNLQTQAHLNQ